MKIYSVAKKILFSVLILATLCLLLLMLPEIWFRGPVVAKALSFAAQRSSHQMQWKKIHASAFHRNWTTIVFNFSMQDAKIQGPSVNGGIEIIEAGVGLDFSRIYPKLAEVNVLAFKAEHFEMISSPDAVTTAQNKGQKKDYGSEVSSTVKSILKVIPGKFILGKVDVDLKNILLKEKAAVTGNYQQLRMTRSKEDPALKISFLEKNNKMKVSADLLSENLEYFSLLQIVLKGSLFQGSKKLAFLNVSSKLSENNGVLEKISVSLEGAYNQPYSYITKTEIKNPCVFEVTENDPAKDVRLSCTVRLSSQFSQMKRSFDVNVAVQGQLKKDGSYTGKVDLNTKSEFYSLLDVALQGVSQVEGNINESSVFHHKTHFVADAKIPEMKGVSRFLYKTEWAIPAPLNNLAGPLDLHLETQWEDLNKLIPFKFTTALRSKEQALKTSLDGNIVYSPEQHQVDVDAKLSLDDIHLALPKLTIHQVPRFFADSRIVQRAGTELKKMNDWKINYKLNIQTPKEHPVRIDSNLVGEAVAINVNMDLNQEGVQKGWVHISPFKFSVFRRNGVFEKMNLDFAENAKDPKVDGRIKVQSGNYEVFATLSGTTDKVRVHLSSEPSAPQNELWAILLFGEPLESLDADQQDSSRATERALAEGGLGLLSLYIFANTPVERVVYDPVIQKVGVMFRVAQGLSLEVGRSDSEMGFVGLKKRLGKGWTLKTEVSSQNKSDDGDNAVLGASVEWSKRY